jgi:O-antigen/teichoic acid export membrane protein
VNNATISSILFRALLSVLNFLILIFTASYFGPLLRGEISLFIANLAIIQLSTDIINGPSVIFISKNKSLHNYLKISIVWTLLSSLLLISILTLLGFSNPDYFIILLIISIFLSVNTFLLQIILSYKKIYPYYIIQLIQLVFQLLFILLVINYHYISFFSFCLSALIPLVLSSFLTIYFAFKYSTKEDSDKNDSLNYKEIIKTGILAQTSNLFNFISTRIGYYFIATEKEELGVFSVAVTICESVWIITYGFASILYPEIAASVDERKNIQSTLNYLAYTLAFTFLALTVLLIIPEKLFLLVLGKKYMHIKIYLIYLSPGIFLLSGGKLLWNYFAGKGQFYLNNIAWGIGSFISLTITYFLINKYGIIGLASSMTISYFAITATMAVFFYNKRRLLL